MVYQWSKQREQNLLRVNGKATATSNKNHDTIMAENRQLRRKLEQTEKRLQKTELLVELQKKLPVFMEMNTLRASEKSVV